MTQQPSSKKEELTPAQQELYDYLVEYFAQNHCSPTHREMMVAMGLKSPAPIQSRLRILESKGYITRPTSNARSVRLTGCDRELIPVPKEFVVQVREFLEILQTEVEEFAAP